MAPARGLQTQTSTPRLGTRPGLSISAIAERTGKDRKTVRKYLRQGVAVPRGAAASDGSVPLLCQGARDGVSGS